MIYKNALVCNENFDFVKADIKIENGLIAEIGNIDGDGIDMSGKIIMPGFVDIHIHGCNNADCTDGKENSVYEMSKSLAKHGVTSFCPTTMTLPEELLARSFSYVANAMGKEGGAYIHGINMEGPFISQAKKGAQAGEHIKTPNVAFFRRLNSICSVKLCDIAPETEGAYEFIEEVKNECVISAAHTTAGYDIVTAAIEKGLSHATHLFNAMTQFGSRDSGAVGAFFDDDKSYCELICDGIHISPATLRTAFKVLGEERTVVISDSMMAADLEDGDYTLGGQKVIKNGYRATLEDGTLAGSVTNLHAELLNLISFGIPKKQAIKSVTINPAKSIGVDNICGSIATGKNADLVILNNTLENIEGVVIKGIIQ